MNQLFGASGNNSKTIGSGERGASLLLVFAFVALVAGVTTAYVKTSYEVKVQSKAYSAGWHAVQLAKAARIFVRNNSMDPAILATFPCAPDCNNDTTPDDTYFNVNLGNVGGPTPVPIPVNALINAGLLPLNFQNQNTLNHTIQILAANYPLDGDPTLATTVATAYLYFQPGPNTTPADVQYLLAGAIDKGLVMQAPVIGAGNAVLSDCWNDGTPDVVIWPSEEVASDCFTEAEFAALTGDAYAPGALVIPTWLADIHDFSAMMRFPQPQNPNTNIMVTNLNMGPANLVGGACPVASQVIYFQPDGAGGFAPINTGICSVAPDDPTQPDWRTQDIRVDIINVNDVVMDRLIAAQQADALNNPVDVAFRYENGVFVGAPPPPLPDREPGFRETAHVPGGADQVNDVITVAGDLSTFYKNVVVSGRMNNPTGAPYHASLEFADAGGVFQDVATRGNIVVSSSGLAGTPASMALTGNATTDDLQVTGLLEASNTTINGDLQVNMLAPTSLIVTGTFDAGVMTTDPGVLIEAAPGTPTPTVSVATNMDIGTLTLTGITNNTTTATVTGDLLIAGDAVMDQLFTNSMDAQGDTSVIFCIGGAGSCPDLPP